MAKRFTDIQPLAAVLRQSTNLRVPVKVEVAPIGSRDWEAAVGSRIAARARPTRLERGVLWVRVSNSTWAQELSLLSDAILEQLKGRGLAVKGLRFQVGRVEAPERPPERSEPMQEPPEVPLPREVLSSLAHVEDDDLRSAIRRAAAKNLGWQAVVAQQGRKGR